MVSPTAATAGIAAAAQCTTRFRVIPQHLSRNVGTQQTRTQYGQL
jgi:hypothetical protein